MEEKQEPEKKFDLRTHIRNPKTGEVEGTNHYKYVVSAKGEYYVRGGNKYSANGDPMEEAAKPAPEAPKPVSAPAPDSPPPAEKPSKSKAQEALDKEKM